MTTLLQANGKKQKKTDSRLRDRSVEGFSRVCVSPRYVTGYYSGGSEGLEAP